MGKTRPNARPPKGSLMDVDDLRSSSSSSMQPSAFGGKGKKHAKKQGKPGGHQHQQLKTRSRQPGHGGSRAAAASMMDIDSFGSAYDGQNGMGDEDDNGGWTMGGSISSMDAVDTAPDTANKRSNHLLQTAGEGAQAALELLEEQILLKKAKKQMSKLKQSAMDAGDGQSHEQGSGDVDMIDVSTPASSSGRSSFTPTVFRASAGAKRITKRSTKSNRQKAAKIERALNLASKTATRVQKRDAAQSLREKFKHLY